MSGERKKRITAAPLAGVLAVVLSLASCGSVASSYSPAADPESAERTHAFVASSLAEMKMPSPSGSVSASNEYISIDASGAPEGFFVLDCSNIGARKLKLGVSKGDITYYYDLYESADPVYFPFQLGDGRYAITVYENIEGQRYSYALECPVDVALSSEFAPFLLPSQIVDYDRSSEAVSFAFELTEGATGDLEKVSRVFEYLVTTIKYDSAKAREVEGGNLTGYIPDIDETLATKKGICYDYSALFAAMLRANGIPAKLVMGYVYPEDIYHAWNMIYTVDAGWVAKKIEFNGGAWELADATFGSGEGGKNTYEAMYEY